MSQIQVWDTEHLSQAATYWDTAAEAWEDVFDRVAREMPSPGGIAWEGDAAEAAQTRAAADRVKVRGLSDDLRGAANVARGAVGELKSAKKQALHAVGEAQAQGFLVGEDLSVTDRHASTTLAERAERLAQAVAFATEIREKALALAARDQEFSARIVSAATALGDVTFPESPDLVADGGGVQVVDFRQSPIEDPNRPDNQVGVGDEVERHPDFSDHRPDGKWAPGNSGVDGDAAMNKTFDDMETTGTHLERQRTHVYVTDPETGEKLRREYDALQPTGVPGQFIGIEHKVNQSPITAHQRTVDDLVRSGVPASGTLDGRPIEVVGVDVIRVAWPPPEAGASAPAGVAGGSVPDKVIESAPKGLPEWGTYVSPEELRETGGPFGILQDFRDAFDPPDPLDPDNMA